MLVYILCRSSSLSLLSFCLSGILVSYRSLHGVRRCVSRRRGSPSCLYFSTYLCGTDSCLAYLIQLPTMRSQCTLCKAGSCARLTVGFWWLGSRDDVRCGWNGASETPARYLMRRETTLAISHTTTHILAITLDHRVHGTAVSVQLSGSPLLAHLCSMGAPRFHASTRPATVNLSLATAQHPP
jgi:hypothetical protein